MEITTSCHKIRVRKRGYRFPQRIETMLLNIQKNINLDNIKELYNSEFMLSHLVAPNKYAGEKLIFFISHLFLFDFLNNEREAKNNIPVITSELLYINDFIIESDYDINNEHIQVILNYIEEKINELIEYSIDLNKPWEITLKMYTPEYIMKSILNRIEYEKKIKETEGITYLLE